MKLTNYTLIFQSRTFNYKLQPKKKRKTFKITLTKKMEKKKEKTNESKNQESNRLMFTSSGIYYCLSIKTTGVNKRSLYLQ